MSSKSTIYIGLSGGVDSSVAAYLLKTKGADVRAVYANCFYDEAQCRSSQDHMDATRVAASLGVPLRTLDYQRQYSENVLGYFYDEYRKGRTPNPDVLCNSEIKFGVMATDLFRAGGDTCLATGHYVANLRLSTDEFRSHLIGGTGDPSAIDSLISSIYKGKTNRLNFLASGKDDLKDQSYFLYRLYDKSGDLLRYVFPLSEMTKAEVRALASKHKLAVAEKPDSQGICFVGDIKLREFIKSHVSNEPGDVVDINGEVIGSHNGVSFYTIGQRHGFKIKKYSPEPLYIVDKIFDKNVLVVGPRALAYTDRFTISELSFPYGIEGLLPSFSEFGLSVRVRNLGRKILCEVRASSSDTKSFEVILSDSEFGVAPGQSAVFYIGRIMLGGGVIQSSVKSF